MTISLTWHIPAPPATLLQILFWKKRAEEALQRSGLKHTIVRPGGLKSRLGAGESTAGNIVMRRPGTYGFPPLQKSGSILRSQVGGDGALNTPGVVARGEGGREGGSGQDCDGAAWHIRLPAVPPLQSLAQMLSILRSQVGATHRVSSGGWGWNRLYRTPGGRTGGFFK